MSVPQPVPESQSARDLTAHAEATKIVQTAFANGWIDVNDLDRRLEGIANAGTPLAARAFIVDLEEPMSLIRAKEQQKEMAASHNKVMVHVWSTPFYVTASSFVICAMIWSIVAMSEGFHYFWPVWVLLPVVITYPLRFVAQRMYGTDDLK